jgi:hypothetical protein
MAEYDTEDEVIAAIRAGDYEAKRRKRKFSVRQKGLTLALFGSSAFWGTFFFVVFCNVYPSDAPYWLGFLIASALLCLPTFGVFALLAPGISSATDRTIRLFPWLLVLEAVCFASLWLLQFLPPALHPPPVWQITATALGPGMLLLFAIFGYLVNPKFYWPPDPLSHIDEPATDYEVSPPSPDGIH